MKGKSLYLAWMGILGVVLLIGFYTIFRIFTEGHGALFHTDDNVPWTLLIAAYVFFVLTSTGVTFVASLPTVFGFKQYEPLAKRSIFIAIAALLAGFSAMGLELGSPLNMYYYIITPNFSSPIMWMGLFYFLLLIFLIFKFYRMHKGQWHSKLNKILAIAAFIVEIAALSTLGLVFGLMESRPTFFGEYIQAYFLFTAILSGVAVITLFTHVYYKVTLGTMPEKQEVMFRNLEKIFVAVIGITLVFAIWRATVGIYANRPEFSVIQYMFDSYPYQLEILVGLLIPFGLMIVKRIRRSHTGKIVASICVILGLAFGRMDMIMAGQIQPIMPKLTIEKTVVFYFPTIWEWIIGFFSLALMLFIYTLGEKYLKLGEVPEEA